MEALLRDAYHRLFLEESRGKSSPERAGGKSKNAYATFSVPDEIKTPKEAEIYIWEQMKRAVKMRMIELLPEFSIYQLEER